MEAIVLYVVSALNLGFSVLILIRNRRSVANLFYGLVIFSASVWSLGLAQFITSKSLDTAKIWAQVYYVAAAIIAYGYYYFARFFPIKSHKRPSYVEILFLLPVVLIVYLLFFTNLHLQKIQLVNGVKDVTLGSGYYFYMLYFVVYILMAFYNWFRKRQALSNLEKVQLKYVFIGTGIALFFGSYYNLFLPIVNYKLIWAGPIFTLLMIAVFSVAIVRYRLMNIRFIIAKSFLYFLLVSLVSSVFAFTSFFIAETLRETGRYGRILVFMVVSFIVVIALDPLKRFLAKITDDIFYKDKIDYQQVLRQISIIIAKEIDLEILLSSLRTVLTTELKIRVADILVKKDSIYKSLTTVAGKSFQESSSLVEYLMSHHNILITDEFYHQTSDLSDGDARRKNQVVLDELERNGIEFCAPVFHDNDLRAIIILGQKQSGDIFTREDTHFFNNLGPQIAVAIEKSQLYESIGEFNLQLQDKINRATRKLKETNFKLEEANAHLKQLDTAKSEFLSIASHQLRTPISAIKGYLSMLLEGDFGSIEEKQRKIIVDLFESSARLARLINIFLNVSRIESGRFKLERTLVDINELVDSVMKELKGQADAKKLTLHFERLQYPIKLFVDGDKIREVILNLVDNAIKYTPKGGIRIKTFIEEGNFRLSIHDTGIGIRQSEVKSLFRKFVRGTGVAQVNTQGSGLGLYIAQRVVTEHTGKIWAESEGLGKGSTFQLSLPIKANEQIDEPEAKKDEKSSAGAVK